RQARALRPPPFPGGHAACLAGWRAGCRCLVGSATAGERAARLVGAAWLAAGGTSGLRPVVPGLEPGTSRPRAGGRGLKVQPRAHFPVSLAHERTTWIPRQRLRTDKRRGRLPEGNLRTWWRQG